MTEINVPKTIEFLESFKEISGNNANSLYRWQELLRLFPEVKITSYRVTKPMGMELESINFVIDNQWRYTLHIATNDVGEPIK